MSTRPAPDLDAFTAALRAREAADDCRDNVAGQIGEWSEKPKPKQEQPR